MANEKGDIRLDMKNSEEKPARVAQRSISIYWQKKSDKWTKLRNLVLHEYNHHHQPKRFLPEWNTVFAVSCVLAVSLDPLFLYIPIVNEDSKCLKFDKRLKAISFGLRLLTDLFYIADGMYRIFTRRNKAKTTKAVTWKGSNELPIAEKAFAIAKNILQSYILLDILAVLPVPQVVLIFFSKMRGSRSLKAMKFLNSLLLLQYVPRVLPVYLLCEEREKTCAWVKGFLNFFLYILASHVMGALWYFFAIHREIACWQYACRSENGCEPRTFSCDDPSLSYRNITILNDLCPINPPNVTRFDFGIFIDALQSGVLQSTNFPEKFLNCLWWGLRNLSSFGQNLETGTYAWENLFAVVISIIGLLLVLYLIGNLQTYMQFSTETSEDLRRKMKMKGLEVEVWLLENRLPKTMKTQIMENVHRLLEKDKSVHLEILDVMPLEYLSIVTRCLCLDILRKVPKLNDIEGLDELRGVCEYFKPVIYPEDSFIFREGEHLDMLLLVTQGTVVSYTTRKKDPSTRDYKHIKQGDFYGVELITWASKFPPSTELPISGKNVRSITRVEAFVIVAEDLKNHVVLRYFWWQFTKGIDLNNLTDSQMLQLKQLAVINSQRAFRRRKKAEKPAAWR